jgi:hypothetical protein
LIDKSSPDEIMFFCFIHITDFTPVGWPLWALFWALAHAAGALTPQLPE